MDRLDALWAEEELENLPTFIPQQVDRYSIKRLIGRGSFGIVCLAHDELLDREVALKIARPEVLDDEERLLRFKEEARLTASLDHPYIVPLYEAKLDNDVPFLASAYCPGPDLGNWLIENKQNVSFKEAATFVMRLTEAVQYAHEKNIVHRDLKPSNILLSQEKKSAEFHLRLQDVVPKLTDFGLAKSFGDSVVDTRSSLMIGTPLYMAPEQLEGNTREASSQTVDIYALGCLLYELLTGRTPIIGESYIEVMDGIRNSIPPKLRSFRNDVPKGLEVICEKCLEKLPADRYQSAQELVEDLGRFLIGEQVRARPLGKAGRLYRLIKKHTLFSSVVGIVLLLAVSLLSITAKYQGSLSSIQNSLREATSEAKKNYTEVHKLNDSLAQITYAEQMAKALDAYGKKDFSTVKSILAQAKKNNPNVLSYPWKALHALTYSPKPLVLKGHDGPVRKIRKVPGKRQLVSTGNDGTIRLWDCDTGELIETLVRTNQPLSALAVSPDGSTLATGTHFLTLWNISERKSLATDVWFDTTISEIAFSEDGKTIACGARNNNIILYTPGSRDSINIDAGAGNESILFVGNNVLGFKNILRRRRLYGWDVVTGNRSLQFESAKNINPNSIAFNQSDKIIALSDSMLRRVLFCNPQDGKELFRTPRNLCSYTDLVFSTDGRKLVAGDQRGNLHILNVKHCLADVSVDERLESMYSRRYIPAHNSRIHSVCAIDEDLVATASEDGLIKIWPIQQNERHFIQALPQQVFRMRSTSSIDEYLCLLRSNEYKLINHKNNSSLWKVTNLRNPKKHDGKRGSIKLSRDKSVFASYGINNKIDLWETKNGNHLIALQLENSVVDFDFSSNDKWMVAAGVDGYFAVWNTLNYKKIFSHKISGWATAAAFSLDNEFLAIGGRESEIHIINTDDWAVRDILKSNSGVHSMAFCPSTNELATAHDDGAIHFWNYLQARHAYELRGHTTNHIRMAFHPTDQTLLSASEFGELFMWDLQTKKLLGAIWKGRPKENIRSIGFTKDGNHFFAHLTSGEVTPEDSALLYINTEHIH